MGTATATGRNRKIDLGITAALFLLTMAVYRPVAGFGWINFDDPQYVPENPNVTTGLTAANVRWAFSTHTFAYWHPLTWLSYQADVSVWGVRPGPIHVENAVLHSLSAALWYLLWANMTGRRIGALLVALLFALHPTRVESVAWVAERKDVLSTFLVAATMLVYAAYTRRAGGGARACSVLYVAACAAYALAVAAKPMVVTLPVLLLLLDWWPLCRLRTPGPGPCAGVDGRSVPPVSIRRAVIEKLPFFAMAVTAAALTLTSSGQSKAVPTIGGLGPGDRLATAVVGFVRYLGTLVFPVHLSIFYPYRLNESPAVWLSSAAILALISWVVWRVRVRRPYAVMGWLWFIVCLLPVCGLVQSGRQSMADRFAYVAAIGPFVAVVWLGTDLLATGAARLRPPAARRVRVAAGILAAAVIVLNAVGTIRYLPAWRDGVTIFSYSERSVGDRNETIEGHLGTAYVDSGRPDLALEHLVAAVELDPGNPDARIDLGAVLIRAEPAMALRQFQAAEPQRSDDPFFQFDLGQAYAGVGQADKAEAAYRNALRLRPNFPEAAAALSRLRAGPVAK
jgi:hypothetical protein